ncbi:hypothetical protein RB195_009255 [Necator americanus]|uniref:Uncharacterized protein n=1 Tax=Necator americanus TaxID=51031 RepID=A0ABR1CSH8_NECAM
MLNLVRAATTGQDPSSQKERVLEDFVARLRPDIRYYVKLDNPLTFEQAVAKAQMVEQLLTEATTDRLINPVSAARTIEVKAVAAEPPRTNFGERSSQHQQGIRMFSASMVFPTVDLFLVARTQVKPSPPQLTRVSTVEDLVITLDSVHR